MYLVPFLVDLLSPKNCCRVLMKFFFDEMVSATWSVNFQIILLYYEFD